MNVLRSCVKSNALPSRLKRTSADRRPPVIWTHLQVSTLLLLLIEAGGDPSIFCYRMGVDILSAGRARLLAPVPGLANWAKMASLAAMTVAAQRPPRIRNQVACSNLFSTFSAHSTILKD